MQDDKHDKIESLKNQGNECVKKGNFAEAVLHYTHAIQLDPKNHILHSNRSLAFLKVQQFYYALEDAKETIKLRPKWPKGYFREGEVYFAVENYAAALESYKLASGLDSSDKGVLEAVAKATTKLQNLRRENQRRPWIYTFAGFSIGLLIVLSDQFLTKAPVIQNIVVQVLLVAAFVALGYIACHIYRYIKESEKGSLLEPPIDLFGDDASNDKKEPEKSHKKSHSGTAAARQRYKMGKS